MGNVWVPAEGKAAGIEASLTPDGFAIDVYETGLGTGIPLGGL